MLGRGTLRKRRDKTKALASEFEGMGNVDLKEAFDELSTPAFALWLRISGERRALRYGRRALADITGYSLRRVCELLTELESKGYVSFVRRPSPYPDGVVIERRCVVGSRSGIVQHGAALI
jgi:hypothetical protein